MLPLTGYLFFEDCYEVSCHVCVAAKLVELVTESDMRSRHVPLHLLRPPRTPEIYAPFVCNYNNMYTCFWESKLRLAILIAINRVVEGQWCYMEVAVSCDMPDWVLTLWINNPFVSKEIVDVYLRTQDTNTVTIKQVMSTRNKNISTDLALLGLNKNR